MGFGLCGVGVFRSVFGPPHSYRLEIYRARSIIWNITRTALPSVVICCPLFGGLVVCLVTLMVGV